MALSTENAAEEQAYERKMRELLANEKLPSSITGIRFELDTDHVGDPAVRVFLTLAPDFSANFDRETERREELRRFRSRLRSKIFEIGSLYYPFIRLVDPS